MQTRFRFLLVLATSGYQILNTCHAVKRQDDFTHSVDPYGQRCRGARFVYHDRGPGRVRRNENRGSSRWQHRKMTRTNTPWIKCFSGIKQESTTVRRVLKLLKYQV